MAVIVMWVIFAAWRSAQHLIALATSAENATGSPRRSWTLVQ